MTFGARVHAIALRAATLLASTSVAWSQGGPPLLTDDPGTPGDGRFELNLATAFTKLGDVREIDAPLVDFNYGVGEHIQLKFELPYSFVDESGGDDASGFGRSKFGVKWRFHDADAHSPALSFYPQIGFEGPLASDDEDVLGETGTTLFLPFEAGWELDEFRVCAELGYEWRDVSSDEWITGIAFGRELNEHAELLAEIHVEADEHLDGSLGVINFGTRIGLARDCSLLASIGHGIWSDDAERVDLLAYLGVQFFF